MKHLYLKTAFTLVELVIVIVILAILSTIGFISYEEYLSDARDSKRVSQISGLRDGMRLATTRGSLPLPDNKIDIKTNGITFLYQGYAGKNVLDSVGFNDTTRDPQDEVYYTYVLSTNRKDFQLMGFLEKYNPDLTTGIFSQSYAGVDYSLRYPNVFGKKLGILLQQVSNTPLQELAPYTASGYYDLSIDPLKTKFDAYITDTYLISGSGTNLNGIIPFTTCKKILEKGDSRGDGYYYINPSGVDPFPSYCNMTLDGGGWTMIARSVPSGQGAFGWLTSAGEVYNNNAAYSLGNPVKNIFFDEIMYGSYSFEKNINVAVKLSIDQSFMQTAFQNPSIENTQAKLYGACTPLTSIPSPPASAPTTNQNPCLYPVKYYGKVGYQDRYSMGFSLPNYPIEFLPSGFPGTNCTAPTDYFDITMRAFCGKQAMIFVR